jgi:hypothetical protein
VKNNVFTGRIEKKIPSPFAPPPSISAGRGQEKKKKESETIKNEAKQSENKDKFDEGAEEFLSFDCL